MQKFLNLLNELVSGTTNICKKVFNLAIPVGGALIGCDIVLGTNFGVLQRLLNIVAKLGIKGNVLTIMIVVVIVLWYTERKKPTA